MQGPKHGGAKERVTKAAAGITFSVVLTESGKGEFAILSEIQTLLAMSPSLVFTFGSEEKGQLANGSAGERIVSAGKSAFDYETEPSTRSRI